MAIYRLTSQDNKGISATASVAVSYPAVTNKGDLLIASVWNNNSSVPAITGWTGTNIGINATTAQLGLFYKIADGTEASISATASSATAMHLHIYEYTGNANPAGLDVAVTTAGNSTTGVTTFSTASITTVDYADLIFATMGLNGSCTGPTYSTLTTQQVDASAISLFDGDLIPGIVKPAFAGTASWTTTLKPSAIIVAFKANLNNLMGINSYQFVKDSSADAGVLSFTEKIR